MSGVWYKHKQANIRKMALSAPTNEALCLPGVTCLLYYSSPITITQRNRYDVKLMTFELVNGKVSLDITTSQAVFCGTENWGEMKTFHFLQIPFIFRLPPRSLIVELDKTQSIMRQHNVFTLIAKLLLWFRHKGNINLIKLIKFQ